MIDRENRSGYSPEPLDPYPPTVSEEDKRALIAYERRIRHDDYDLDEAWWIEPEPEDAA